MEIKIEIDRGQHCETCLSYGRCLFSLGKYSEVFVKLLDHTTFECYNNVGGIRICWECRGLLRNVSKFQSKVSRAAEALKLSVLYERSSLSTLKTHHVAEDETIECTEVQERKPRKHDIVEIEVKTEEYADDFGAEAEYLKDEEEEQQVKVEKVKVKKLKKERKDKKSQNRKYKVIRVTKDYTMRREPITEQDCLMYLEKERESPFFTKKSFKCDKCVLSFMNNKFLVAHMRESHFERPKSLKCNICDSNFTDGESLSRHANNHCQKYVCNKCEYECLTKQHMRWHLRTTHHKLYQCTLCELSFEDRAQIGQHHKQWHERFECAECGTAFKTRGGIERHIVRQHAEFHCKLCDKHFARRRYLTVHNQAQHSIGEKIDNAYCVECDKHFSTVASYKSHLYETARHRNVKKSFPCPGCGKSFSKKTYLNEHYDHAHLNLARNRCPHCNKTFTRGEHLTRHVRRVHEGVPPVKDKVCYVCGRAFSLNRILIHHLRTHTGERPHLCPRCPASFSQRAALVTHARAVHKMPPAQALLAARPPPRP